MNHRKSPSELQEKLGWASRSLSSHSTSLVWHRTALHSSTSPKRVFPPLSFLLWVPLELHTHKHTHKCMCTFTHILMQTGIHIHTWTQRTCTEKDTRTHTHQKRQTYAEREGGIHSERHIEKIDPQRDTHRHKCTDTQKDTPRDIYRHSDPTHKEIQTQRQAHIYRDTQTEIDIHIHFLTAQGGKFHFSVRLYQCESWRIFQPLTVSHQEQATLCELSDNSMLDGRLWLLAEFSSGMWRSV